MLGFCKLHYPILFATLPSKLVSGEAAVPGLKHDTHFSSGILDSAAYRADSFRAIWPAAFGSMVSQQQPQQTMEANKEEPSRASNRSKVGKRAYRRARNKAAKEGSAVYKGRVIYSTGQSVRVPG